MIICRSPEKSLFLFEGCGANPIKSFKFERGDDEIAMLGRYFNQMTERTLHLSQSMAKSVTSAVTGILVAKGLLDPEERITEYESRVAQMYERGKAVNFATAFEIDEVIDPMKTRQWIMAGLKSAPTPPIRDGKKKPFVDTW